MDDCDDDDDDGSMKAMVAPLTFNAFVYLLDHRLGYSSVATAMNMRHVNDVVTIITQWQRRHYHYQT